MMKSYWKPQGRSSWIMAFAAAMSVLALGAVEYLPSRPNATALHEKRQAATLASQAFEVIKADRLERGIEIDPATDPTESGLVGQLISPVTSNNGHLPAKQVTVNPNFAAVVVDMLKQAGVEKGDTVAVGFSGSFPAMNICVLSALETLEAKPLVISSASASQWGANHPELLWIDMERILQENGVFSARSLGASLGGVDDQGVGMPEKALEMLRTGIQRNNLTLLKSENLQQAVDQRMQIYREHANGETIKAYINVGGGATSVGTHEGKKEFDPGVNLAAPPGQLMDSVMARFATEKVPVIHLVQIQDLAMQYGLPTQVVLTPRIGEGDVYSPQEYNPWLAGGSLVVIVLVLASPSVLGRAARPLPKAGSGGRLTPRRSSSHRNGHSEDSKRNNGDDSSLAATDNDPIL